MYLETAFVSYGAAFLANSSKSMSLTTDWTSPEDKVLFLLNQANLVPLVGTLSKVLWMKGFIICIALLENTNTRVYFFKEFIYLNEESLNSLFFCFLINFTIFRVVSHFINRLIFNKNYLKKSKLLISF
jgi:hypothetical protein